MLLTTERLALRPLCTDDVQSVYKYSSDFENTKYMMFLPNESVAETQSFLQSVDVEWNKAKPAFYEFAVLLNNFQIGAVGLYLDKTRSQGSIGWILDRDYHNKGYATEAAQAVISFAKHSLRLQKIIAQCDYRNIASQRVMEKLGMTLTDANGVRTYAKRNETATELTYVLVLNN